MTPDDYLQLYRAGAISMHEYREAIFDWHTIHPSPGGFVPPRPREGHLLPSGWKVDEYFDLVTAMDSHGRPLVREESAQEVMRRWTPDQVKAWTKPHAGLASSSAAYQPDYPRYRLKEPTPWNQLYHRDRVPPAFRSYLPAGMGPSVEVGGEEYWRERAAKPTFASLKRAYLASDPLDPSATLDFLLGVDGLEGLREKDLADDPIRLAPRKERLVFGFPVPVAIWLAILFATCILLVLVAWGLA